MSWTYSGDPSSSDLELYRFMIGDTDSEEPLIQDEEIEYILTEYTDKNVRLYNLYNTIAQKFSREIKRSIGPTSEDPTERAKYYISKANEYKAKCVSYGLTSPTYQSPKVFSKGMHKNA